MLTRQGAPRILYLDFLAPSLLNRNASSSATPNPRPPRPLLRQDRVTHASQILLNNPHNLLHRISEPVSIKARSRLPFPTANGVDLFAKTTTKLDAALGHDELSAVRELWATLVDQNLLKYLGIPQLQRYSKSIASMYRCRPGSCDRWSVQDMETMQTIAIYTALCGHSQAIRAVMLHHLKSNEPDEVLKLYQTYVTSQSKNQASEIPEPTGGVPIPDDLVPPEKSSLLLVAIAACAMKGSFSDAVGLVIQSNTPITYRTVKNHIRPFPNAPVVESYVQRLELVHFLANPSAFFKHVDNMTRERATNSLERFCKNLIAAVLGEEPWLVVTEDRRSRERPVVVPRFTWTALITALTKCKRLDLARSLWEDMIKCGVEPDASIWTAVFDGYRSLGAWQESLATWDTILAQDVEPEPLTYRAIIATLFKARRPDDAMTKFKEYEQNWVGKGGKKRSVDPTDKYFSQALSLHNTVLHGLLTNTDRETDALALFERMKTDGPTPDLISWNTIMGYYGRRGSMKMISSTLQGLKESGLSPDVFTYSTILTALLKAGREDAPRLILDMMKKDNIDPGAAVNTTIIDQLLREPDVKNIKAAFNILNRMEGERTPAERPNEVTYTAMLVGIYRWGKEIETYHSDIVQRMGKRNIWFNRATCHILIRASLESSSREGARYALDHFDRMMGLEIEPDFDTWYIILDGMLRRGEVGIANDLLEEMTRRRYEPTGALFGLVRRVRREQLKRS